MVHISHGFFLHSQRVLLSAEKQGADGTLSQFLHLPVLPPPGFPTLLVTHG